MVAEPLSLQLGGSRRQQPADGRLRNSLVIAGEPLYVAASPSWIATYGSFTTQTHTDASIPSRQGLAQSEQEGSLRGRRGAGGDTAEAQAEDPRQINQQWRASGLAE
jgi:hypothetical protein